MAAKGILVGLGNPIMSDDGIGLLVSERVHQRLVDYELDLSCGYGFHVVDSILGYSRAVIIDSMVTGRHPPATVALVDPAADLETLRSGHTHGIGFMEAIAVARSCRAPVPARISIYGIEVKDPFSVGQRISATLLREVERMVDHIASDIMERDSKE